MTRRNKCDICRKAKVKCDEDLPRCSGCARRGKECTRTYGSAKKDVRFVEVKGKVIDGTICVFAKQSKDVIVPSNISSSSSPTSESMGDDCPPVIVRKIAPAQLSVLSPSSEQISLLGRWIAMMYRDFGDIGLAAMDNHWCFSNWTIYIPRYIGITSALDDAAKCYLDCKLAFADPTDANLLAVQTSKLKAFNSVRLALETKGSRPVKENMLLAVHMLYVVEALMLRSHSTMVTHVKGLISLLHEQKKDLEASDADGNLISSCMFISAFSSGLFPALIDGEDHALDNPHWLDYQLPPSNLPVTVLSHQTTQRAWETMARSYVAIPRLARLIRHLKASPKTAILEQQVVDLARHLYATTIDPNFFSEATSLGELWVEPTVLDDLTDIMPTSYGFKSSKVVSLLAIYWIARLLICGLVEKLVSTVPSTPLFCDRDRVEAEDIRIASEVLMVVQYVFTGLADTDTEMVRIKQLQLLSLLQMAFGAWCRMGKRQETSVQEGGSEEAREGKIQRADMMKRLCLDLGNRLTKCMQLPLMDMESMEATSEMFTGGDIVQFEFPNG